MRSKRLWLITAIAVSVAIAALASYWLLRPAPPRIMQHAMTGYVLEVTPEMNRITVRNADIPGTMASMVMDYCEAPTHYPCFEHRHDPLSSPSAFRCDGDNGPEVFSSGAAPSTGGASQRSSDSDSRVDA